MPNSEESLTVTFERSIGCPPERLWEALYRPSALESMHPFVARHVTPERGIGASARDTVIYHSGIRLEREVVAGGVDGSVAVDVDVFDPAGNLQGHAHTEVRVTPDGDGCRVRVDITARAQPGGLRQMQEAMTRQYLDQMLQGFAHFCETGEPVRRNQFGAHPFYSPEVG